MHPEIVSDAPGQCPKCGMALVSENDSKITHQSTEDKGLGILTWHSYIALITIFAILFLATAVLSWRDSAQNVFSLTNTIAYFMAGFFLVFAGFKLMDLRGFAEGYSTYDLLAQKWFGYGYVFSFIELGFGLAMLAGFKSANLLWAEVIVMVFSGIGVALKLAKREKIQCACLGTFLKIPLTKITLIEDFGMALLALVLIALP